MTRYSTPGPWTTIKRTNVHDYNERPIGAVQIETGPLIDSRGGYRYEDGAHRVTVSKRPAGFEGGWPRGKTFKGEMAWCQAESYARDCVQALDRIAHQAGV